MLKSTLLSFLFTLSLCTSLYGNEKERSFYMEVTNNLHLNGEVAHRYGDNLNTGSLEFGYRTQQYLYLAKMTSYTQKYDELNAIFTNLCRVDTLELGVIRKIKNYQDEIYTLDIHLGVLVLLSGNFGGEGLQNLIHSQNGLSEVDIPYSNDNHMAIGLQGNINYTYTINPYLKLFGDFEAKVYSDASGIFGGELGTLMSYKAIEIKLGLGSKYIRPFKQELIEALTINTTPLYLLGEIKVPLTKTISMKVGTIISGDHPYGNSEDDPFSYLNFNYNF